MSSRPEPGLQRPDALRGAMSPAEIAGIVGGSSHVSGTGVSVRRCEVRKVRPTEDGNFEVQYRLELADSRTGDAFTTTILGTVYPDERGESESRSLLERSGMSANAGSPDPRLKDFALYLPERRLLLRSPSIGERLQTIRIALDAEAVRPFLAGALSGTMTERAGSCQVEILRYSPGKRCTLRYRLGAPDRRAGEAPGENVIGKVYAKGREAERVFAIMQELYRHGFGGDSSDGIRIPRPLGYVRELRMLLMEDVAAPPMTEAFSSPRLADHLEAAARALAKIHTSRPGAVKSYGVQDELSALRGWVSRATRLYPGLVGPFHASLALAIGSARDLPDDEPVLAHGDFYHRQILVGGDRVTIVDLDTLCRAQAAKDVGNFLAHLRWKGLELSWSQDEAKRHAETFLSAYRRGVASRLDGIEFYYRAALLRLACLVAQRPRSEHLTLPLLGESDKTHPL